MGHELHPDNVRGIEWLQRMHTREILKVKTRLIKCNRYYDESDSYFLGGDQYGPYVTKSDILKELATREHIPNKKEGKDNRKKNIKQNSKQSRNRACVK